MRGARIAAAAFVIGVAVLLIGAAVWLLDEPATLEPVAPPAAPTVTLADAARDERVRRGEAAAEQVALIGARIIGTVTAADGSFVTGAEVALWTRGIASPLPHDDRFGEIREDDGPDLPLGDALGHEIATTTTGSEGAFALEGLAPGGCVLLVTDPEGRTASRAVLLPATLAQLRVDVRLPGDAFGLGVRVVRADGRPFVGRVGVEPDPAFTSAPAVQWREVDVAGAARFVAVPFRTLRLVASGRDGWHERSNAISLPHEGVFEWTLGAGLRDVRGTVRDLDSAAPIAGADVRIEDERGVRAARTDDAGAFTVSAGRSGVLRVTAEGYGAVVRRLGEGLDLELLLAGTGSVTGRVTRLSDGGPLAGTTVWAGDWLDPATPRALTGPDGSYRVDGVRTGLVWMRVHGDGWVTPEEYGRPSWRAAEVRTDEATACDLVAMQTGRLEGRVLDPDGRGVAGAHVGVGERSSGHRQAMQDVATVTDADGYFAIDGIFRANQPKFVCRADDFPVVRGDAPRVYAGSTKVLEITLSRPIWLDVSVVADVAGTPVAGALVSVRRVEPGLGHHHVATAPTAADGSARLGPLAPGRHWVDAVAPGLAEAERLVAVDVAEDGQRVVVRMQPALGVSGTLVRDGAPVAFARVRLMRDGLPDATRTGPDGAFSFGRLPAGAVGLSAEVEGRKAFCEAEAGATDVRLELVEAEVDPTAPDAAPRARIEVRAQDGAPVPSFKWRVVQSQGGSWKSVWNTGRDGAFTYEVDAARPERLLVIWEARDAGGRRLPVHVLSTPIPDGPPDTFTFTLPATTPTITGRVVDQDGAIVAGGFVHAVHGGADRSSDVRRETIATFPVDENGGFRVDGFASDAVRLVAVPPPAFTLSPYVDAEPGAGDAELRVRPAARAVITVVDDAGHPVPGATVYVEDEFDFDRPNRPRMGVEGWSDDVVAHARTGQDGRAVLERLDPSFELALRVRPQDRGYVADLDEDEAWTPRDMTVVLNSKGEITGVVRLSDGSPAGSAMVYVRKGDRASGTGVASDGSFRLTGVPAGSRSVVFAKLDGGARSEEVEAGTDAPVTLTIDPGACVVLAVLNEQEFSAPVRLAPNPYGRHSTPRVRGEVLLSMLDPDLSYTVLVGPDGDGRCALLENVVADGGVRYVDLAMGETLEGLLRPPDGFRGAIEVVLARGDDPLAEGQVHFKAARPSAFSFQGVPPGEWTLLLRDRFDDDAVLVRRAVTLPLPPGETVDLVW